MRKFAIAALAAAVLSGCATNGEDLQADVFDASDVNTAVPARVVTIITVSPTKIKVENKNRKAAQVGGGLLGAALGVAVGATHNTGAAVGGAALGGVAGAAAGSLVDEKALVPGVLLSFQENGKIYTSAQVGRMCQFKANERSLVVTTKSGEARVQPNAECPVEVKK